MLVFISFKVACFGVPCRQGLCYCRGPGAEQFPVFTGQRLLLQFYACAITRGHSFMVLSVWGILISFWSVLVFSPTLFSLLFLLLYYYFLFIFFLSAITVIIISTGLLALCDRCSGWG